MSNKNQAAAAAATEQPASMANVATGTPAATQATTTQAAAPARKPLWERFKRDATTGQGGSYEVVAGKRVLQERTQHADDADGKTA